MKPTFILQGGSRLARARAGGNGPDSAFAAARATEAATNRRAQAQSVRGGRGVFARRFR